MSAYLASVTLHLLAAVVWIGGLLFIAIIAPTLRKVEPAELRNELFRQIGERFRLVGWTAVAILIVTGTFNLYARGLWGSLLDPEFWRTGVGQSLAWKLVMVAIMLGFSALHDFIYGPRAARLEIGSPEASRVRRVAIWLARGTALAGVLVIYFAVRIVRG